jgi:hypothetical protein
VKGASRAIKKINPIDCWMKEGSWPKVHFEQDDQTRQGVNRGFEKDS